MRLISMLESTSECWPFGQLVIREPRDEIGTMKLIIEGSDASGLLFDLTGAHFDGGKASSIISAAT